VDRSLFAQGGEAVRPPCEVGQADWDLVARLALHVVINFLFFFSLFFFFLSTLLLFFYHCDNYELN